jgi:hypothetical protein
MVLSTGLLFIGARSQSGGELWILFGRSQLWVEYKRRPNQAQHRYSRSYCLLELLVTQIIFLLSGDSTFASVSGVSQVIEDTNTGSVYVLASAFATASTSRGVIWKFNSTGTASSFGVGGRVRVNPGTLYPKCALLCGLVVPGFSDYLYVAGSVSNTTGKFMFVARVLATTGAFDTDQGTPA